MYLKGELMQIMHFFNLFFPWECFETAEPDCYWWGYDTSTVASHVAWDQLGPLIHMVINTPLSSVSCAKETLRNSLETSEAKHFSRLFPSRILWQHSSRDCSSCWGWVAPPRLLCHSIENTLRGGEGDLHASETIPLPRLRRRRRREMNAANVFSASTPTTS